jgi:hypothetical protein
MDIEKLVEGYVKLRDKKAEVESRHKDELAPIRKLMADIENKMLQQMEQMNTTSLRTKAGTAYQTTRVSATVADRDIFRDYCAVNDAWELADIRAGKTAIRAMVEETGELPPGINWREDIGVNFKR